MYHHVVGEVVALTPTRAVIEAMGVGYELSIPFSTYRAIKGTKGPVRLLTHFVVREDSHRIFGFATEAEREVFRNVVAVNGVGPAVALAILSSLQVEDFIRIVGEGNSVPLRKIKGVGRKLADRLMVELNDRLPNLGRNLSVRSGTAVTGPSQAELTCEAVVALMELGFSRKDGEQRVEAAVEALSTPARKRNGNVDSSRRISVEEILTRALRSG